MFGDFERVADVAGSAGLVPFFLTSKAFLGGFLMGSARPGGRRWRGPGPTARIRRSCGRPAAACPVAGRPAAGARACARPLWLTLPLPVKPNSAAFAGVSGTSSAVPSQAASRSPKANAPGVRAVAGVPHRRSNSACSGLSPSRCGAGQRRAGGQLLRQRAQNRPVSRWPGTIGTAEQAQREDEVDHRPGRQQPSATLAAAGQLHDLVHQLRTDLLGQHAEPNALAKSLLPWCHLPVQRDRPALSDGRRHADDGTLSTQRSSLVDSRILADLLSTGNSVALSRLPPTHHQK